LEYSVTWACFICASIITAFNPLWSESEVSKRFVSWHELATNAINLNNKNKTNNVAIYWGRRKHAEQVAPFVLWHELESDIYFCTRWWRWSACNSLVSAMHKNNNHWCLNDTLVMIVYLQARNPFFDNTPLFWQWGLAWFLGRFRPNQARGL
jgi:hypothetical protein